jgi:hypothetical protein
MDAPVKTLSVRTGRGALKTSGIETKKPFDRLAEGRLPKDCRGNWTLLELFMAGIRGWPRALLHSADAVMPNTGAAAAAQTGASLKDPRLFRYPL